MPNYDQWLNDQLDEYNSDKSEEEKNAERTRQEDVDYEESLEREWEVYDE